MKKLGKKTILTENTLAAYACLCDSGDCTCSCYANCYPCNCDADPGSLHESIYNTVNATTNSILTSKNSRSVVQAGLNG